ncbi:hypothetical protein BLAT2472_40308 [Burkholderia latens]
MASRCRRTAGSRGSRWNCRGTSGHSCAPDGKPIRTTGRPRSRRRCTAPARRRRCCTRDERHARHSGRRSRLKVPCSAPHERYVERYNPRYITITVFDHSNDDHALDRTPASPHPAPFDAARRTRRRIRVQRSGLRRRRTGRVGGRQSDQRVQGGRRCLSEAAPGYQGAVQLRRV